MTLDLQDLAFLGGLAVAAPTLWTPAQLTTAMWFDANDGSTITQSGALVSQWNDKSGNARNATQSGGSRPTYTAAGLNGLPVITFGIGGVKSLQLPSISLSSTQTTIMMVVNDTRNTGASVAFVVGGYLGVNLLTQASSLSWGSYTNTGITANSDIDSQYAIASVQNDTTNFYFTKNGLPDGQKAISGSNVFAFSFIGADQYGSFLTGSIAEILFFTSNISLSARQLCEGYLAWKWGLQSSLPSDHPYESAAPTV